MRQLYAPDHLDDLVRRGINYINTVASAVRYINTHQRRRRTSDCSRMSATHPVRHCNPVRVALRRKLSAARMKRIAARFWRQKMKQEPAFSTISRVDLLIYFST